MKSHVPAGNRLTKAQKEAVMEYDNQFKQETFRRFMKLMALALTSPISEKGHGMGATQISKYISEISRLSNESENDPVFWQHVDKALIDQKGLDFKRENYTEMGE